MLQNKLFKPQDFDLRNIPDVQSKLMNKDFQFIDPTETFANHANLILKNRGQRVYAERFMGLWVSEEERWAKDGMVQNPTHRALLVCVEELKTDPCRHNPESEILYGGSEEIADHHHVCKHCGEKIKPVVWGSV